MINYVEREQLTLGFSNEGLDRGSLEESMAPWDKTVEAFREQGYDSGFLDELRWPKLPTENLYYYKRPIEQWERFYNVMKTDAVERFEVGLGWDPLKRIALRIPFYTFEEEIIEETDEYIIIKEEDGWTRKHHKNRNLIQDVAPVVSDWESWEILKAHTLEKIDLYFTPENMEKAYGKYRDSDDKFAIRMRMSGFFWQPRELMGVEDHLMSFILEPELIKDINQFQLDVYMQQMEKILKIIQPSTLFFEEDISGKTGPMISPETFEEIIEPCYNQIIPFLKERGVRNIFMDTDGDFTALIPGILRCGLDGVMPVDVNAGVDIVEVRKAYPTLKFWGGFNKLCIVDGPEAIDKEFKRLEPVIRQGGCIICTDHQIAPHTPLDHYRYFVNRLREVMTEMRGSKAINK